MKQVSTIVSLFLPLASYSVCAQVVLSGLVQEAGSYKPLQSVNVYAPAYRLGTVTNKAGYYTLKLPAKDSLTLVFSFVGYEIVTRTIPLNTKQPLDIYLTPGQTLNEVSVTNRFVHRKDSQAPQLSHIEVPIANVHKIPALLGEKDVLKVIQLLPGVQKGAEGNTGIYVRGGAPDQNLITVDEAVIYNPSHLLGFFSVFNGDVLQHVELTKGGFPARFGGRLSSVIQIDTKEGDKKDVHGTGSVGLIASRFMLEGPLIKNSASFVVSTRQCYLGYLAQLITPNSETRIPSRSDFSDYTVKSSFDLGSRDHLSLSGYTGSDYFKSQLINKHQQTLEAGLSWGNTAGTLRWSHRFSQNVMAHTSFLFSRYQMHVTNEEVLATDNEDRPGAVLQLKYRSRIRDFSLKHNLDVNVNPSHQLHLGFQVTPHRFTPGAVVTTQTQTDTLTRLSDPVINTVESGVYAEDFWHPTDRWRVNAGLRLSYFWHPQVQFVRPEPRLSIAYKFGADWTIKGAYALMNQYVHMLSNTGLGLPTDLWVPATNRIKPQQSQQVAMGLAKDFNSTLALNVEGYYKLMRNNISYREGASFLVTNENVGWEANVTAGKGWSYGGEVMLQKKTGRLSGWIGYTLSWTQWQFPDLNGGRKFFPRYDRRHDFSLIGIYELSPRFTLSGTWVYGTGQALTVPLSRYSASANNPNRFTLPTDLFIDTRNVKDYGEKNSFRAEAYHRMDISLQFHAKKQTHKNTWEFTIYNVYNRRNPFYYTLEGKGGSKGVASKSVLYRYSLFPVVPTLGYTLKF